jgi:hypothetical protein
MSASPVKQVCAADGCEIREKKKKKMIIKFLLEFKSELFMIEQLDINEETEPVRLRNNSYLAKKESQSG